MIDPSKARAVALLQAAVNLTVFAEELRLIAVETPNDEHEILVKIQGISDVATDLQDAIGRIAYEARLDITP